jgi:hypothetical protein
MDLIENPSPSSVCQELSSVNNHFAPEDSNVSAVFMHVKLGLQLPKVGQIMVLRAIPVAIMLEGTMLPKVQGRRFQHLALLQGPVEPGREQRQEISMCHA